MWIPSIGMGWVDPDSSEKKAYNAAYLDELQRREQTDIGRGLIRLRVGIMEEWVKRGPRVVDVGIGAGGFVAAMREAGWECFGDDVNPQAIRWLHAQGWLHDAVAPMEVATFWDVLEHLPDPSVFVRRVRSMMVVTMPVYDRGGDRVRESKHYKPGEHLHYWSTDGFLGWASQQGFRPIHVSTWERELTREDVTTFVLRRVASPDVPPQV